MPTGGKRPGAGHPTKASTELKRAARTAAALEFVEGAQEALPDALETLKLLAAGIWVEWCTRCRCGSEDCRCMDPDKVRLYKRPPDRQANEILIEHGRGKAAQAAAAASDMTITLVCNVPRPPAPAKKAKND